MKNLYYTAGAFLMTVPVFAQTDPVGEAVTTATGKIDTVATTGVKAYLIAAGLATLGVVIAFIRKAKK